MASCHEVLVGVESNDVVFDPVISGVGGGFGALLGFIVGAVVMKCFFLQKLRRHLHSKDVHPTSEEQINTAKDKNNCEKKLTEKKVLATSVGYRNENFCRSSADLSSVEESALESEPTTIGMVADAVLRTNAKNEEGSSIIYVLCLPSLEIMVQRLASQKKSQIENITVQSWHSRHICMVEIFKLILEEYCSNKQLSRTDSERILGTVTKDLDASLDICKLHGKVKQQSESFEENRKDTQLSVNVNSLEVSQKLTSAYFQTQAKFESDVLACVGLKNASMIHEVLVKSFKTTEENIQLVQEYEIKVAADSFHRNLLIAQAYHSGQFAMRELMKKRRHYFEVMLRRLVEWDRIGGDESEALWDSVKDAIEEKYDAISTGHEDMVMKLKSRLNEHRRRTLSSLEDQKKTSVKKYMKEATLHSPSQRIHSYFALLMRNRQEEVTTLEALSKSEIADMDELQKKAKTSLEIEYEEMQERFCESLATHNALSAKDAQEIMNELIRKNKKADEDVASIGQIQTKIIDRELTSSRSFHSADPSRSNYGEAGKEARSKIIRDDLNDAKAFLNQQVHLNDEDRQAISREYKAFSMMLCNCEDVARYEDYHKLDAELLRREIKILLLERQEGRLSSDEDISDLVKRLDDLRLTHERDHADSYSEATCNSRLSLDMKQSFLCDLSSVALISNLFPQMKSADKLKRYLFAIKECVHSKARNSDSVDERILQEVTDEGSEAARQMEAQLRQEHDVQVEIVKERIKAEHEMKLKRLSEELDVRPFSASSLSTAEVLERLMGHERNKRDVEAAEAENDVTTMTQVYLQRVKFQNKLEAELQNVERNLVCKVAKLIGMKRNDLVDVVRSSLQKESASEAETKRFLSDFAICWGSVPSFTTRPVNHQFQETRLVDEKPLRRAGLKPLTKLRPKSGRGRRKNILKRIAPGTIEDIA